MLGVLGHATGEDLPFIFVSEHVFTAIDNASQVEWLVQSYDIFNSA